MSKPRYLPLHHAVHATRKTKDNLPFFAPERLVIHAIRYVLAVASSRYGVGVAAFAIMGNHIHLLLFDEDVFTAHANRVADFIQFVYATLALFTGRHWEIKGAKLDPDSTGNLTLIADHVAELETSVYINLNPVEATIVADPFRTPLVGSPELFLEGEVLERPDEWFSDRTWPEKAVLQLKVPPMADRAGYVAESWAEEVRKATDSAAKRVCLRKKMKGETFCGLFAAARNTPARGPISEHKAGHDEALVKGTGAAAAKLFADLRAFYPAYRRARERVRNGEEGVKFPFGTYKMAKLAPCRARPPIIEVDFARWLAKRLLEPTPGR